MPRKKATDNISEENINMIANTEEEPTKKPRARKPKAEPNAEEQKQEAKTTTLNLANMPKAETADKRDILIEELMKQVEALKTEVEAAKTALPQVVVAAPDSGERVHLLWQAEVADDNIVEFGDGGMYGRIVGKTGSFYVPKNDLSRILNSSNRLFLDRRWLIVVSGLTDDEREALGVDYKEGELIDKKAFQKLLGLGKDELLEIYPELCESHKEMIAKRFYEAYMSGRPVKRDIIVALNNIAPVEAFKAIINGMNEADLGE